MHTPEIREFTKEDWYSYAGAERFNSGAEPLVVDIPAMDPDKHSDITIIADKAGISVMTDYGSFMLDSHQDPKWDQELARCVILYLLKHERWVVGDVAMIVAQCTLDNHWVGCL